MRYVSIDIETTGASPEHCQVLEFAAVIEDTRKTDIPVDELPSFRVAVQHRHISGSVSALSLNARLLRELSEARYGDHSPNDHCTVDEVIPRFAAFLGRNGFDLSRPIMAAGKNFAGFDLPFIRNLPGYGQEVRISNQTLDPAILYLDWQRDYKLPSMRICKQRAGLSEEMTHQALDDAKDVIRLLRPTYSDSNEQEEEGFNTNY